MFRSLIWKLTLAFMLVAFITVGLVALIIRITSTDRFAQFIIEQQQNNLQQMLSAYYQANGSWDYVGESWPQMEMRTIVTPVRSPGAVAQEDHHFQVDGFVRANFLGLADADGVVVVQVDPQYPVGAKLPEDLLDHGMPVLVDGVQVGTILTARQPPMFNPQEERYLKRAFDALLVASFTALVVALVIGVLLARTLTRPLQDLTQAAQNITKGQLEQQVRVRGNDEISQLGKAFNTMSQEVARVNQLRRQMTADVAHDLRTPLTVISGYIESMRDGVLTPTAERMDLIYLEIERLQKLVGDLRDLSLADAGELQLNPQKLSPQILLQRAAELFRLQAERHHIAILVDVAAGLPDICADEARMMQVLGNLIDNAIRFTPPGGVITLSAVYVNGGVEIMVSDTGKGIPAEELPHIFNRFQRGDKSRHIENGESGLGLAIVKTLVESHGGSVSAESATGGGTTIRLHLPVPA